MESVSPEPQIEAAARPALPAYEPPAVTSYTDEQLLEALGPAQARPAYGPVP